MIQVTRRILVMEGGLECVPHGQLQTGFYMVYLSASSSTSASATSSMLSQTRILLNLTLLRQSWLPDLAHGEQCLLRARHLLVACLRASHKHEVLFFFFFFFFFLKDGQDIAREGDPSKVLAAEENVN